MGTFRLYSQPSKAEKLLFGEQSPGHSYESDYNSQFETISSSSDENPNNAHGIFV
jgi:hypothetical protein